MAWQSQSGRETFMGICYTYQEITPLRGACDTPKRLALSSSKETTMRKQYATGDAFQCQPMPSTVGLRDVAKVDVTTLPAVLLAKRRDLPSNPGIYFVCATVGSILYIGRALSLRTRWSKHHRLEELLAIPYVSIAWLIHEAVEELAGIEAAFITRFHPPLNGRQTMLRPFWETA